jgi:hypothetical protein
MSVVVALTIVAPSSPITTWTFGPVTDSFGVGETIVSVAVDAGRVTLVVEPEAAAEGAELEPDAADVVAPCEPDAQPAQARTHAVISARILGHERGGILDLICRG